MDLKINKEVVPSAETIYDGIQEQNVELDYILPDYYPDIFRLISCRITPVITDYSITGDRLTYDLKCDIHILYCGENDDIIRSITQSRNYSGSAEIGCTCDAPEATLIPKTDHVNFRAVNKRRLDLRGAVSVKINVTGDTSHELISDAFGMNIQLRKFPLRYISKKLTANKTVRITEDIELSQAQPDILGIIFCRCTPGECEKKMISGKLLAKGNLIIKLLYSCKTDDEAAVAPMTFELPYSQIIDIDELDDTFECTIVPEVISCDVTPGSSKSGEKRFIKCETELRLSCRAIKLNSVTVASDAYSTVYPCEVQTCRIKAEQIPVIYKEGFRITADIAKGDNIPQNIYSMWCTPKNINTRISDDGRGVFITGMLTYTMAAKDASGLLVMPDKDEAFEELIDLCDNISGCTVSIEISVGETSYNISSEGNLTAKADLTANISVSDSVEAEGITDISINDAVKKERDGDYAIKLYFGTPNEEVWDIAKRYSTSVSAVMEENELDSERLSNGGMLLIPIVT